MAHVTLTQQHLRKPTIASYQAFVGTEGKVTSAITAKWFIRFAFYAFVFSLPFEEVDLGIEATLPKLFGVALAGFGVLQHRLCYRFPPNALLWFLGYLAVYSLWGGYLLMTPPNVPTFANSFLGSVFRLLQLLVLFWIGYNLLQEERVTKGTLWALAVGVVLLAIFQMVGVTTDVSRSGRVSAFDANPNGLATVLSLGLLALFGLAYGRMKGDWQARALFWTASGLILLAIVQTGSRGAVLALAGSLSILILRGKSLASKLKFGGLALAGIIAMALASYHIDAVRKRWEHTFYEQSLAGRQRIFPEAVGMIFESPVVGWGPIVHLWELGPRLGLPMRDEHNVYLWILAETGIAGAIPFFMALCLCCRSAWRSRFGVQGYLPFVMLLFVLLVSMKGSIHHRKYYWLVLSYALASSTYVMRRQKAKAPGRMREPTVLPRRAEHRPDNGLLSRRAPRVSRLRNV